MSFLTSRWSLLQKLHLNDSPSPRLPAMTCLLESASVAWEPMLLALGDDLIDDAVFLGCIRRHDEVPVRVALHPLHRLPRVVGQDAVQALANPQDLLRVDVDVRRLPGKIAHRLVQNDSRIWQCKTLFRRARGEQDRGHAGGLADADGRDIR